MKNLRGIRHNFRGLISYTGWDGSRGSQIWCKILARVYPEVNAYFRTHVSITNFFQCPTTFPSKIISRFRETITQRKRVVSEIPGTGGADEDGSMFACNLGDKTPKNGCCKNFNFELGGTPVECTYSQDNTGLTNLNHEGWTCTGMSSTTYLKYVTWFEGGKWLLDNGDFSTSGQSLK